VREAHPRSVQRHVPQLALQGHPLGRPGLLQTRLFLSDGSVSGRGMLEAHQSGRIGGSARIRGGHYGARVLVHRRLQRMHRTCPLPLGPVIVHIAGKQADVTFVRVSRETGHAHGMCNAPLEGVDGCCMVCARLGELGAQIGQLARETCRHGTTKRAAARRRGRRRQRRSRDG
jgi:hypothetical protein